MLKQVFERRRARRLGRLIEQGDAANRARDWAEAERRYEAALALDPFLVAIWVQLGHARKEQGRREAAETCYRRAIALDPEDADAHLQLGHALKLLARPHEAREAYARAAALHSADAEREVASVDAHLAAEVATLGKEAVLLAGDGADSSAGGKQGGYRVKIDKAGRDQIRGWAVRVADPDEIIALRVEVDGLLYATLVADIVRGDLKKKGLSGGRGGFEFRPPPFPAATPPVAVALRTPDGAVAAEVVLDLARPDPEDAAPLWAAAAPAVAGVSIVVPVYNAPEDLEFCLAALAHHTTWSARLILIDDASSDLRVASILKRAAAAGAEVLRNPRNLGFSGTVNRGLEAAGRDDVVLLNSDARVTPRWLESLREAAYADPRIATVTPLSDNAGAFSAPEIGQRNPLPDAPDIGEDAVAVAVRRAAALVYPTVPTGNGFCLYVKRACLDDVGVFDAEAFPRGYGEENDFCMRARARGWRHVVDDATYIFHERSKSFGAVKTDLMAAGRQVVDARWPDYAKLTSVFGKADSLRAARFCVARAHHTCLQEGPPRPRALFVYSTRTGGTPQTNRDLMGALDDVYETWTLHCDSRTLTLFRYKAGQEQEIERRRLDDPVEPATHRSFDYDRTVARWLRRYGFELTHIRHLGWHSLSLPRLAREAGAAVVLSFHDYYAVCPTVKLLDDQDVFCGGRCTASAGDCPVELWEPDTLPPLKHRWIHEWRRRFGAIFPEVDAFVTTSPSTRARIRAIFPELPEDRFFVIAHGRDFCEETETSLRIPSPFDPIRVLVPGNINAAKGLDVVEALLDRDVERHFEFHILGTHQFKRKRSGLVLHGPYEREKFAERVQRIAPHAGAILSIWDETWCHTLTELWQVGLPAITLDFETVATRVRSTGAGWVYDHRNPDALYAALLDDLLDEEGFLRARAAAARWKRREGAFRNVAEMGTRYLEVYRIARERRRPLRGLLAAQGGAAAERAPLPSPAAPRDAAARRVAVLVPEAHANYASTHIRLLERTRNNADRDLIYLPLTPERLMAGIEAGEIARALFQRTALPAAATARLAPLVETGAFRFAFDLDDDLLDVPADKDLDGRYAAYRPALEWQLRHAALVTVSTPHLLRRTAPFVKGRAAVVPNRLSPRFWRDAPDFARPEDGLVRALYMGTRTHDADLALIRPALEAIVRRRPGFRLIVVGGWNAPPADLPAWIERRDPPPERRPYSDFVPWLRDAMQDVDFALAPLAPELFNASKSGLKLLDYAGLGLSGLYSDTAIYRELVYEAGAGRLVGHSSQDWERALGAALEDVPALREEGLRMRHWVVKRGFLPAPPHDFDALLRRALEIDPAADEGWRGRPPEAAPQEKERATNAA